MIRSFVELSNVRGVALAALVIASTLSLPRRLEAAVPPEAGSSAPTQVAQAQPPAQPPAATPPAAAAPAPPSEPPPAPEATPPAAQPPPPEAEDSTKAALPEEHLRKMIRDEMAKGVPLKVGDVMLHGYFRTGIGVSSQGGRMTCFQAPTASAKYRLGNECDQYGEFLFSVPAAVGADGVVVNGNLMLALYSSTLLGYGNNIGDGSGNAWIVQQMWFDVKNLAFLSGGTPWIGRRYYKREDVHVQDFFYWNPTGLGGGIEDVELGKMKLSYAIFAVDDPPVMAGSPPPRSDMGLRNDIQLRGIPLHPGGQLNLGLDVIIDASDNDSTRNGFAVDVMYVLQALGGENKVILQYGTGPGIDLSTSAPLTTSSDDKRLRLIDLLSFQPTPELGGQAVAIYEHNDMAASKRDWISAGGRVGYAFSEHVKLLAELGFDTTKPDGGKRAILTKLTIAPTIAAGRGFWGRPELRLFGTFAFWNHDAAAAGVDSEGLYTGTDKTSGATFGIHADGWW